MNNYKDKVLKSRKITKEEYSFIISLLDKYKMDKTNFINNAKKLKINKVDEKKLIVNGYDPIANIIYYNDRSNLICELLHVASSNNNICQGIIVKPNKVYTRPFGIALNEGITDLFLERGTKREGYFPFEKACAKTLKYAYGNQIFDAYFKNDDGTFRHQFDKSITVFMDYLDDYSNLALYARNCMQKDNKLPVGLSDAIKILMDIIVDELLKIITNDKKDCRAHLEKQLNSKSMQALYKIIGEYKLQNKVITK